MTLKEEDAKVEYHLETEVVVMMKGFSKVEPVKARQAIAARSPKFTVRAYSGKHGPVWTGSFNRACAEEAGWIGGVKLDVLLGKSGDVAFVPGDSRCLSASFQFQLTAYQEQLQLKIGTYPVEINDGTVIVKRAGHRELYEKPEIKGLEGTSNEADL